MSSRALSAYAAPGFSAKVARRDPLHGILDSRGDEPGVAAKLDSAVWRECSHTTMLARGSRRSGAAFTLRLLVTTWKPPSRHSCQTGDKSTVPSRRYVAKTASRRSPAKSPRSSMARSLRMLAGYARATQPFVTDRESSTVTGTGTHASGPGVRR